MKPGRNSPCPCGSGKKYKKCCLEKDEAQARSEAEAASKAAAADRLAEKQRWGAERARTPLDVHVEEEVKSDRDVPESDLYSSEFKPDIFEPDWPPLGDEDKKVVDVWWEEVGPLYTSDKQGQHVDSLLKRVGDFLDQHPALFRYLYLHEEFVFELGGALARLGRMGEYVALLRRLAREQDEMYLCCFGYYDLDVIADLIRTGDRAAIPMYLERFKRYPGQASEQLPLLLDLLAWRGLEAELTELTSAPALLRRGYGEPWSSHLAIVRYLEAADTSPAAQENLRSVLKNLRSWILCDPGEEKLGRLLRLASMTPAEAGLDLKSSRDAKFLEEVAWSYMGWLRRRGLNWLSARFAAERMGHYWAESDAHARGGRFRLDTQPLDEFLAGACRKLFWLEGVHALGTIQAMAWSADYLAENGYFAVADARRVQSDCARVHEQAISRLEAGDPARCVCPDYASLVRFPLVAPDAPSAVSPAASPDNPKPPA